jgi:hypothetical protein
MSFTPMRRLVVLAGCTIALAGCGGGGGGAGGSGSASGAGSGSAGGGGGGPAPPTQTTAPSEASLVDAGLEPPEGCYVTVLLVEDVTKPQVDEVQAQLLSNKAIFQVSFVPKTLELKRAAQANPAAAKDMHVDQFADRFEVVPRMPGTAVQIAGAVAKQGGPITNAKPSAGCAAGPGG